MQQQQQQQQPSSICVLGSANADLYVQVLRLPKPGETVPSLPDSGDVKVGGKGVNQAVAARLATLSADHPNNHDKNNNYNNRPQVSFLGNFGDDSFQPLIREALRSSGVNDDLSLTVPQCSTGMAIIILQEKGENSIILVGGANLDGWQALHDRLEQAGNTWEDGKEDPEGSLARARQLARSQLLLLQCEVPFQTNLITAKFTSAAGGRVMLDLGGFNPADFDPEVLGHLHLMSANEPELSALAALIFRNDRRPASNHATADAETALSLCQEFVSVRGERLPQLFLITLGGAGAVLIRRQGRRLEYFRQGTFPFLPEEKVIDTTGAGDCYRGVFAAQYVQTPEDLPRCMDMAAAAASYCIQYMGAMPSYPQLPTILDRLQRLRGESLCEGWQSYEPVAQIKQKSRL